MCRASSKNAPLPTCQHGGGVGQSPSEFINKSDNLVRLASKYLQFRYVPIHNPRVWRIIRPRNIEPFDYNSSQ